jgi:hypothetical protein
MIAKRQHQAEVIIQDVTMTYDSVRRQVLSVWLLLLMCSQDTTRLAAEDASAFDLTYSSEIAPLLDQYCFDCHAGDTIEADLDLSEYRDTAGIRSSLPVWLKIRRMLDSQQMPPKDSPQPIDPERIRLTTWVRDFLKNEALVNAGDPGPVVLRRLNNEEYNYTVRDLTGLTSLDPTREFPVDGASGEGFINTGMAQAMSPSLVQKYFDAAREVAAHVVLLPDGIAFSEHTTRRDRTDELVQRIQQFYSRYTDDGGGQKINLQGIEFDTNQGGVLPLELYLRALIEEATRMDADPLSIADVARERKLSAKYLGNLRTVLNAPQDAHSYLLNDVRSRWKRITTVDGIADLVAHIRSVQNTLWKFNVIGHIGDDGQPPTWLEPINSAVTSREFSVALPENDNEVILTLAARNVLGENRVVWRNPRLTGVGADIPLSRLSGLLDRIKEEERRERGRVAAYLAAADEASRVVDGLEHNLTEIAKRHDVDPLLLRRWLAWLAIGDTVPLDVSGHFTAHFDSAEHPAVRGWGTAATPAIQSNSSDEQLRVPGIARPHAVVVHPSPTLFAAVGWQSPVTGLFKVEARASDAHPECGNGQEWTIQHRSRRGSNRLSHGEFGAGGVAEIPSSDLVVREGELVSLIIGPRAGSHACDLTEVNLVITQQGGDERVWDLAKEVSANIQEANPHADAYGNDGVWHFYQGAMNSIDQGNDLLQGVPPGSLLATWQAETDPAARRTIADRIGALVADDESQKDDSANTVLCQQILELMSPLNRLESFLSHIEPDADFGPQEGTPPIDDDDLAVMAHDDVQIVIPAELAAGRTFVASGRVDSSLKNAGAVNMEAAVSTVESLSVSSPVIVADTADAQQKVQAAFDEYRMLFAPAVCYARIVPVDEVVTITLFYRQDDLLQRMLLNDIETAALEDLWEELLYVSQEPLQYQVAFEQTRAFATQDRPDLVKKWVPLTEAVDRRAASFRQTLKESESTHIDGVIDFADRAWRRSLAESEQADLRDLYADLLVSGLDHEAAIQLTLARVLTSPTFLYRLEQPGNGKEPIPVQAAELASRLSYFLWSSLPDETLRHRVADNTLISDDVLAAQTKRMLQDPRTRRLAIQFACQWLHLRNFDLNDDKNESLYPEFATLRNDMYEETVLFFEDLFRNDGSILDLLNADHTFLNGRLAKHYGIDGVAGDTWQKVVDVRSRQRGGVLAMATVLASQSGASRTSPILRGNWVYETLLGERLPRPPANVPQLPETVPEGLTARQLIERHSSSPECARCHVKVDPYGFALEQYDVLGRIRSNPVDTSTTLADGQKIKGIGGLRRYLLEERRDDIVRQFCRKLLGFSLGRETRLSDEPLLDTMMVRLEQNEYRFHTAVETIVLSPQFRQIRGIATVDE